MIFTKLPDAICLNDNSNILIFPLTVQELQILNENVANFENYINLSYNTTSISQNNNLKKQFELLMLDNENFPINSVWVIVSAKDKSIVGTICPNIKNNFTKNTNSDATSVNISLDLNNVAISLSDAISSIQLFEQWLAENGAKSIFCQVEKDNDFILSVFKQNNYNEVLKNNKVQFKKQI